jgi:hypothetical protein
MVIVKKLLGFSLSISLIVSCAMARASESKAYGFVHLETTGITSYVIAEGKRVAIRFSDSSDAPALAALEALRWQVLLPNADGRTIVVIGELDNEKKMTPSTPNMAQSQVYYDFRLTGWTIKIPFIYRDWKSGVPVPGERMVDTERDRLVASDFKDFKGKAEIDLRALERTR